MSQPEESAPTSPTTPVAVSAPVSASVPTATQPRIPDDPAQRPARSFLNKDQRKHIASVIDKIGIAYFAAVGYTAYTSKDWLLTAHALVVFAVIEAVAVRALKEPRDDN